MDRLTARSLMASMLKPMLRPDQQYNVTPEAKNLLDENADGKISNDELLGGLMRDQVSFDPKIREIIANRSRMALDPTILPRDHSASFGTVEQCMEFAMRYFKETRAKSGKTGGSFDVDFGPQHDLADEVRQMANGTMTKPGYDGFLNGGVTPPRAGDILAAESDSGDEFHIALVTSVEKRGDQWQVTVFQANVPFNFNSHNLADHLQTFPLEYQDGHWTMPTLPTSQYKYGEDMDVVGWIHPEAEKALPGAAA